MRRRRGLVAAAAIAALGVLGGPAPAGAASSVESGWWTSAPVALAPDVAEGQLLVQGGVEPARPLAYAGISFTLADGEAPEKLVLAVAPGSGTTPGATVSLCALGAPATPSHGEAADLGPSFDCATKVDSTPSADGASYTFDVASFVRDGAIDVALVPTVPTDRVVFAKPAVDALQGGAGGGSTSGSGAGDGGFTNGGFSDGGTGGSEALEPGDLSLGDVGGSAAGIGGSLDLPPIAGASPAATAQPRGSDDVASGAGAAPVAATRPAVTGDESRSLAPFLFAGLAIAAAALWALAGHESPEPAADTGGADG